MNNTLSLQQLFNNRIFLIPDYQRGYAWEKQQVGEFLDDLELLRSASPIYQHYTGTIVLCRVLTSQEQKIEDDEGISYDSWDVVDGQQRLTTIVLLLNEVSRALNSCGTNSTLADGTKKQYVHTSRDGQPLYKLSLNKDTHDFFKSNVLPEKPGVAGPPTTSARRLWDAKGQIAEYLRTAGGNAETREHWLQELRKNVIGRLHFNLYEVEDTAEVGIIFEVMNDRGKPLTNLEKVKNYLLHAASLLNVDQTSKDELTGSVKDAWSDMLERLMAAGLSSPSDEDGLLRAHWLMQYNPQSKNWEGSKSVKNRFDLRHNHDQPTQVLKELHQYIKGLREACICYCDALKPGRDSAFESFSSNSKIKDEIKLCNSKLVRIGVTATFLPLLMAVRMRWPAEPEKYLDIARLCEVFAFRFYQVSGYYANFRQSQMFHLANRVYHGMAFDNAVHAIKQNYNDGAEKRNFDEFTNPEAHRDWYGKRGLRYFLYEYEQHLASSKGASPKVSWADILGLKDTVEHVLPQSIQGQCYWQKRFTTDAHKEYVHDLGNLTLTKHNPVYGNKPFPEKKGAIDADGPCYAKSPFFQEQELAQYDEWTKETISDRRAKLLEWAKVRWGVDFSGIDTAQPESDGDEEEYAGEE